MKSERGTAMTVYEEGRGTGVAPALGQSMGPVNDLLRCPRETSVDVKIPDRLCFGDTRFWPKQPPSLHSEGRS